jgi:hypothetical protein
MQFCYITHHPCATLALFSASTLPLAEIYPEPFDESNNFYCFGFSSEEISFFFFYHMKQKSTVTAKSIIDVIFFMVLFFVKNCKY